GVASLSLSQTAFGCAEAGANAETLTVTDVNGNISTCSTTVTVEDNVAPVALCRNVTVQLDANGNGSTSAAAVDNGSNDACGVASLSLSQTAFGCAEAGANAETLTVTDVNGNISTCSTTVTVEDNIAPVAICLNTTVNLEPNGTYALKPTDVYNAGASSDNCGIASVSFPPASFTCDQAGAAFPITVTVEDFSGNTDQCIAMVSVEAGTALPAGWAASDIGSQGAGSSYDYDPCASNNPNRGDFTVSTGAYNLIPNNSDNLAFIGRELCNNGGIQARIEDVSGGYAGLMIRESSAPGAKMVAVYSNLTSLLRREIRTTDNGPRASNTSFAPFPYWLRLVRQNDYIRAFYRTSDNGSWTLFHQAYLPMQPCVEMGLAVFTTDPNGQAQATFSQVQWRSNVGGNSLALFNDGAAAAQPEEREASVFPNPARDAFTLAFSKAPESGGIAILRNQVGQVVGQRQLQPGEVATEWDVSSLPSGLYLMEVRQEGWPFQVIRMIKTN
uniref:T9SS type A sorting domain-containing protein n=1 Tax=Phaeodactylibacter xiamenensis TaxID=1524460 RepID=UPI0024A907BE